MQEKLDVGKLDVRKMEVNKAGSRGAYRAGILAHMQNYNQDP